MGNTHSEAPAQRDRELPPQTVEVHRKDREDEKTGRRSNLSSKEEQQRVAVSVTFGPACVTDPQPDRELTTPVSASGPRDTAAAILDQRVKPNQGKKRKIAKARKWTSGQGTAQEAADKSMGERRQPSVGAHLPGAGDGRVIAVPGLAPSHQAKELPSQHQPQPSVGGREKANVAASALGTTPQHGGHQEPGEGTAHSLPLPGRSTVTAKAGSRAQFTCSLLAPQGKPVPGEGQAASEKESPARPRAHPRPQEASMDAKAEGLGCTDNAQGGKGRPSETELCHSSGKVGERAVGQAGLPLRTPEAGRRECMRQQEAPVACPGEEGGAGLDSSKRGPDQGRVAAPRAYTPQLSIQPLHLERGAPLEELGLAGSRKPLPPGAKTAGSHRASPGTGSGYAPMLELRISPGSPPTEAKPGSRELGDAAPGQDGMVAAATGSKKKLPFYEQLLASLKNQTQKQKGAKPQRQGQAREEASPPKPAKGHCPLEGPITSAKPLPLTIPQAQAQVEPSQPPLLPSPSSFHFEAPQQTAKGNSDPKVLQRVQPQAQQLLPVFQFQSGNRNGAQEQARAFSLTPGPAGAAASSPQPPQGPGTGTGTAQSWLRQQQQAHARPCSRPLASAPSLYCGPLPPLPPVSPQQLSPQPRELGQPTLFRPQVHHETPPHPQAQAPQPQAPSSNPLPPQATSNVQQQQLTATPTPPPPPAKLESPKQTAAQASARGLQPAAGSKPQAPSPTQAKPPKQEPPVPLLVPPPAPKAAAPAPGQASAKGKPPAQAKVGRKASGSSLSQLPLPQPAPVVRPKPLRVQAEPEPDPESKQPAQRPTGRWSAFQIDRTCNRKCQCRHREAKGSSQLPRNIARW
ncbi:hypothetical protein chiPu_0023345 [Chiloscyllium punctatum]|uniref:Uncharacterized protein n=1 Tax=Chiloscyllium punctatum TaxID=137246 RepID=A0A401T8T3_CHIPU|nr:hypothetical protein [Chiloscyllium punctatum]